MPDRSKRLAAEAAVTEVQDGMVLGLGSGTTAEFALQVLSKRIEEGLRVTGIPTSCRTAELAGRLRIPLRSFAECRRIDLTLDGADEVEGDTLNLIKGGGGALLREKIVAAASDRMIVIVDETKLVSQLGLRWAVPVEIVPFGHEATLGRLSRIAPTTLRMNNERPLVTDNGNLIADCAFGKIGDAAALEQALNAIVGVVESGLFVGLAWRVVVGAPDGVRILERKGSA